VLEFTGFSGPDAVLGGGTLTIDIGRWQGDPPAFTADPDRSGATLTVPAGATLTELAETLSMIPGVTARAIEVGDGGWSLGILSETGSNNSLRISAAPDAAPDIAALDFSADPRPVERRVASDALLTVDGIAVLRPDNQIDDLIPGLSLSLSGVTTGPATLSTQTDTDTALGVMEGVVDALNGLKSLLQQVTARGTGGAEAGALAGDAAAMSLLRDFEGMLSGGLDGFGARPVFLADLGLRTERDGRLTLDRDAFETSFTADPNLFRSVLQDNLAATGPGVAIDGMPAKGATPGRYDLIRDPATGAATLGGFALTMTGQADGQTSYRAASGPLAGLRLTLDDSLTATSIDFGQSLATRLTAFVDAATASDGALGRRQDRLSQSMSEDGAGIDALTEQASAYETRMRTRFAEMEKVITQLNSTGDYITNLIDSFNAQN
jgi:flagellar hook-associated protein 2